MNNRKTPRIRFKGFTDDWEQRKVGELTNVLSASRVHKEEWAEDGVPFFRSSDVVSAFKGTENEKAFISVELYEQLAKSSGKLEQNDILITGGGSIGIPYIMPDNKPLYSKDADLIWIKHSANFDSIYLYTYFMSEEFREYLASISHTGTIAHYTIEQVKDTPVRLPSIDEQRKLGNFFVSLDHLITLHQRKLEKLKIVKKAMLENCIPKNGEKVPKFRFSGFTGDWEQRKLGDFGFVAMCKRIFKDQTSENGDVPFYKIGTFGGEPDAYISRRLFEEYKRMYAYPEKGDILISASGSIGRTVEYMGEDAYYQDSNIVWLKHDKTIVNPFLKHLYEVIQWSGIEGSTIKRLYNDNILKTEVMVPSIPEQTEIGSFFIRFDHLITLHQRKLEKLKIIKKSFLEKMFV